jgi:hypothetical protein
VTGLSVSPDPASFGNPVILVATVNSARRESLAGTVAFLDGPELIGTVTIFGGEARLETSNLSVGAHGLSAAYGGDNLHASSTSASAAELVNPIATTTRLTAPRTTSAGSSVTLQASVSAAGGGDLPTGTVAFYDSSDGYTRRPLGEAQLADGVATLTTSLPAGDHAVFAVYKGDTRHGPSTSDGVPVDVSPLLL